MNFLALEAKHFVDIFHNPVGKVIFVNGFLQDKVTTATGDIKTRMSFPASLHLFNHIWLTFIIEIEQHSVKTQKIYIPKHVFMFLQQKRTMFLAELKQQLGLKALELIIDNQPKQYKSNNTDKPGASKPNYGPNHAVLVKGSVSKVANAEADIASLRVRYKKVKLEQGTTNVVLFFPSLL